MLLVPLLLASAPASAGQRAVYLDKDGEKLTISITDDGNATVRGEKEKEYGILRDGSFYLVGEEKGVLHVARIEDMVAAFDQVLPPIFKGLFDLAAKDRPKSTLKIEAHGTRKIAGFTGQVYRVYGLDDGKPTQASEQVLTKDPALQPVGRAMEQFLTSSMVALAPLLGETAVEMVTDIRAMFAYGAPLDMEGRFKLLSLETAAVPPSEAALPAKPDTVEQIVASMKISGMGADPEPENEPEK